LAANPVLIFVTALAGALIYLISTYESEEEQLKKSAAAQKEYSDAIKGELEAIDDRNKIENQTNELRKASLENELARRKISGINAQEELALKGKILDIDKEIYKHNTQTNPEVTTQLAEQEKLRNKAFDERQKQINKLTELTKKQADGVKEVDKENIGFTRGWVDKTEDIEKAIKRVNDALKSQDEAYKSAQGNVDKYNSIIKQGQDYLQSQTEYQNEKAKLSADERKALYYAEAEIAINAKRLDASRRRR